MKMSCASPSWWVAPTTVLAPIVWGTTYVTVTELLPPDRPLLVAALRVLPAGIVLLLIARLGTRWRPSAGEWRPLIGLSFANFGVFFPLLIVAVYRLPGGVAASVGGVQPFLVAAGTWITAGITPRRVDLGVGLAAAVGVAFVVIRPDAGIDPIGVAAALGANVAFSLGVVYTRHLPPPVHPVATTGWQLVISGAAIVPLALLVEGMPDAPTVRHVAGFGYLSVIGTAVAFIVWFNGVRRLPPAAPPLIGLAAPVTGAVVGWIVLAESMSGWQLLGFAITIAAITYGALLRSAPSAERSDRVGDGEDAAGVVDVEALDHPAIDRDHAATLGLGRLERLDHAS